MFQILTVAVRWVLLEVDLVLIAGELKPAARARQPGSLNQAVVFEEPDKDAAQYPCDRNLGDVIISPRGAGIFRGYSSKRLDTAADEDAAAASLARRVSVGAWDAAGGSIARRASNALVGGSSGSLSARRSASFAKRSA